MNYPSYGSPTAVEREVREGRRRADEKHGANGIEQLPGSSPRWLSILVEEVGEAASTLTYDKNTADLRAELIDVLCVASAWVDALDRDHCDCSRDQHAYAGCLKNGAMPI